MFVRLTQPLYKIVNFRKLLFMITTAIVVDDDLDTQEIFSEYLTIRDVKILGRGSNGKEAIDLYKKHHPEITFLDIMMPKFDGIYAVKKIRDYDPDSKIIIVTASLIPSTQQKLFDLDVSAVIWKPYDMDKIIHTIEKVNEGQRRIFPKSNS